MNVLNVTSKLQNVLMKVVNMWASPASGKESAGNAGATGDVGSIPESGISSEGGNGNLLQYFCWKNPMDRVVSGGIVHSHSLYLLGVGKRFLFNILTFQL